MRSRSLAPTVAALAIGVLLGPSASSGQAQNRAPGVEAQFATIDQHGDPLAFNLGIGDDPYPWTACPFFPDCTFQGCKHYQGLARMDIGGIPYFFLTRSGNHTGSCSTAQDNPGELLVVELMSRDSEEERLRSNRIGPTATSVFTIPPVEDAGVAHINFTFQYQPQPGPGWMHPGGVQMADGIVVIPMQGHCSWFAWAGGETGTYSCIGNKDWDAAGLVFVDVSDPLSPQIIHDLDLRLLEGTGNTPVDAHKNGYGAVGVIKESSGRYLVALSNPGKDLAFLRSTTPDLRDPTMELEEAGFWNPDMLHPTQEWSGFQMVNFVRDADGSLYLLAGDNTSGGEPICSGDDFLRMFRVTEEQTGSWNLEYLEQRTINSGYNYQTLPGLPCGGTDTLEMGNFKAAGGIYVSPSGQLIAYTGHHDRFAHIPDTPYVVMGEYRNIDVRLADADGDSLLEAELEVIDVDGDGRTETSCSGWAELYEDASGWEEREDPSRSWIFDYRDRHSFAWNALAGVLNDSISSMRWNLPPGQEMYLFQHFNFGGTRWGPWTGMGTLNVPRAWNDEVTSIRLTPVADAGASYYLGDVDAPIDLDRANPCYVNDPPAIDTPFPVSFEWALSGPADSCVPLAEPPCTFSVDTDIRPSVQCSQAGEYPVRLRVSDSYGSQHDDCAILYVPEPEGLTLLAFGLSGIPFLGLLRKQRDREAWQCLSVTRIGPARNH